MKFCYGNFVSLWTFSLYGTYSKHYYQMIVPEKSLHFCIARNTFVSLFTWARLKQTSWLVMGTSDSSWEVLNQNWCSDWKVWTKHVTRQSDAASHSTWPWKLLVCHMFAKPPSLNKFLFSLFTCQLWPIVVSKFSFRESRYLTYTWYMENCLLLGEGNTSFICVNSYNNTCTHTHTKSYVHFSVATLFFSYS